MSRAECVHKLYCTHLPLRTCPTRELLPDCKSSAAQLRSCSLARKHCKRRISLLLPGNTSACIGHEKLYVVLVSGEPNPSMMFGMIHERAAFHKLPDIVASAGAVLVPEKHREVVTIALTDSIQYRSRNDCLTAAQLLTL